jgi:alpha-L-glutamate ligase-like protein
MAFWRFDTYRKTGILGINRRNADLILGHNPRKLFPLVDDKLTTKRLCAEHRIRTPALYGTIAAHHQVRTLGQMLAPHETFVIKPSSGAMGNGVLVIQGRDGDQFVRASGARLQLKDLAYHVSGILSGLYSLGGRGDRAIVEARVRIHPVFEALALGVPDCRIIVFEGVPVMSMLRLPTRMSDGRANLHQGAIAAGVDLATGRTHRAIHLDRVITEHPDTGRPVRGLKVPSWEEILHIAAVSADMTGLGYLGVDVVIDAVEGPMLLELNARPGLSIQIANGTGLVPLLDRIEKTQTSTMGPEARVALARALFADHMGTGEDTRAA